MAKKAYVKIEGLEKILAGLKAADISIDNVLKKGIKDAGVIVERYMQAKAPKKHGILRINSKIRSDYKNPGTASIYIGPGGKNLDYAFHVEVGTKDTPAKPFARPAVDRNKKKIKEAIDKAVGDAFEQAMRG